MYLTINCGNMEYVILCKLKNPPETVPEIVSDGFFLYYIYFISQSLHPHPRGHASRLRPPREIPDLLQGGCLFPMLR